MCDSLPLRHLVKFRIIAQGPEQCAIYGGMHSGPVVDNRKTVGVIYLDAKERERGREQEREKPAD